MGAGADHPRHGRRRRNGRSRDRAIRRPAGRGERDRRAVRRSAPPLHRGAACRAAGAGDRAAAAGHSRRGAGPVRPAERLPVRAALRLRLRRLPPRRAAPRGSASSARALPHAAHAAASPRRTPCRRRVGDRGARSPGSCPRISRLARRFPAAGDRQGARRRVVHARGRPDAGGGRRIRLRQIDAGAAADADRDADRRRAADRGRGRRARRAARPAGACGARSRSCSRTPTARSIRARRSARRWRSRCWSTPTCEGRSARAAALAIMAEVGLRPEYLPPLSAHVLRRPAPAHRHRARADAAAEDPRARRAGLGARRVDPRAGAQPARGPAGGVRPRLCLRLARPLGGAPHRRRGDGDLPRPCGRDRRARRDLSRAAAPLHARAAVGDADRRPGREARAHPARRRAALADRAAARLRVPSALPARLRPLPDGKAAARDRSTGARSPAGR